MFAERVTNDNTKEKTGGRGRRQGPEWLTGEERRHVRKGLVMMWWTDMGTEVKVRNEHPAKGPVCRAGFY